MNNTKITLGLIENNYDYDKSLKMSCGATIKKEVWENILIKVKFYFLIINYR